MSSVYVINLAASTDRMKRFEAHSANVGLSYTRVEGCDARGRSVYDFDNYDSVAARNYLGRDLLSGEFGCFMSHRFAAERIVASGEECGVVLEDDALAPEGLLTLVEETVQALSEIDPSWLLVNLGTKPRRYRRVADLSLQGKQFELHRAFRTRLGTYGLLWSRLGAQTFLKNSQKIWAPVDNLIRMWVTEQGGGYAFTPSPIGHPEWRGASWSSDIEFGENGVAIVPQVAKNNRKQGHWEGLRNSVHDRWNAMCHEYSVPLRSRHFD